MFSSFPLSTPKRSATINETGLFQDVQIQRPRRNTFGTIQELSSSNESSISVRQARSKTWYEGLVSGIVDSLKLVESASNFLTSDKQDSRHRDQQAKRNEGNPLEMIESTLDKLVRSCPEEYRCELIERYVLPIKQKVEKDNVIIGICGQAESGRRTLLNVLEYSRMFKTQTSDAPIFFRLCPHISGFDHVCSPAITGGNLKEQFAHSLFSCSAYLLVLSCDQLEPDKMDTSPLEVLLSRDRDIFNQRRAFIIVNKLDTCLTADITGKDSTSLSSYPTDTTSTSTEYLCYDRFQDREDYELIIKEKVKKQLQNTVGVDVPDGCIQLSMLKWVQMSRNYNFGNQTGPEIEDKLETWKKLYEPFGQVCREVEEDEDLHSDLVDESIDVNFYEKVSGITEIERWVKNHCENSTKLKELSLLSDIIHCVYFCTDKAQSEIECTAIRIEQLEGILLQKKQLEEELFSYYRQLQSRTKDVILLNSLIEAYEMDIKEPLVLIQTLAEELYDKFLETSIKKLKRLVQHSWEYKSNEAILETFELDIDSLSRGSAKRLNSILKTVTFQRMHEVMPFKAIKHDTQELTKLADHILREGMASETNETLNDTLKLTTSTHVNEVELIYPASLDIICQDSNMRANPSQFHHHYYSILHFHSISIIPKHSSKEESLELKDENTSRDNFISFCIKYLTSEVLKRKIVQFHMDKITSYVLKHLDKFDWNYRPKLDSMESKIQCELQCFRDSKQTSELNLKYLINLKVQLEMKKASLLT